VVRAGEDVTLVATQLMLHRALDAADALENEGIGVEVIDPRILVPFDTETIIASVARPTAWSSCRRRSSNLRGGRRSGDLVGRTSNCEGRNRTGDTTISGVSAPRWVS